MENSTNQQNNLTGTPNSSTTNSFSVGGSLTVSGHLVNNGNFGDHANLSYLSYSQSQVIESTSSELTKKESELTEKNNSPKEVSERDYCCNLGALEFSCGNAAFLCFNLEPNVKLSDLMCCPGKRDKDKKPETKEVKLNIDGENRESSIQAQLNQQGNSQEQQQAQTQQTAQILQNPNN